MARTKISEFSATPASNTDIDSINIAENCAPSGINDAIRELMSQLKDFQTGAVGDSFNGPVGTTTAAAGAFTTLAASGAVTLSGGTANGVPYLNGSKVLTSGNALVFDGTNLGIGTSSPAAVGGKSLQVFDRTHLMQLSVNNASYVSNNLYFDGGGWKYTTTSTGSALSLEGNNTVFFRAASGTAGAAATLVESAHIDSSGNLIQTVNTTAATLTTNQTLTFSIVNNSLLRISVRGSDGTTRTATLALA